MFKNKFLILLLVCILLTSNIKISANTLNQVVDVVDFGADPSGQKDSTEAFIDALEKAKTLESNGSVQLVLPKGTYRITKENALEREVHTSNTNSVDFPIKRIGILIEDHKDLTVEGNGSQILFEGDMMAIGIFQSENIKLQNLSWDYLVPTTSELTVFDFNNEDKTVDYFIPEYFNYKIEGKNIIWLSEEKSDGTYYWKETNGHRNYGIQIKYPTEMMGRSYYSNQDPFAGVESITKLDNGLVRFKYVNKSAIDPVKGMNYQLLSNAIRPTAGALVWESKDVYLDNVQISYMHGFGFLIQMSENVFFNRLSIETDIETGKNTSSYADGIHVSGAKGKIEITNSFFNNTHDDPINIHGTFTRIEQKIDSNTLRMAYIHNQQGGFQQFYPGDKVVFYSRDTLESADYEKEYTVKSVEGPSKDNLKSMVVKFEEEVPDYLLEKIGNEPKYVAENATYTPEILIKNNDFKNVFTRMILVTSRKKVVIEDNRFDAPSMPTLFFSNDSDEWYESGPIRDLEIRNNTFKIRTLGRTWWKYSPAIYFHPVTKGGEIPSSENPIHKNILIEDNTFYLESDGAMRAESVENLTFKNNKVFRLDPEINLDFAGNDTLELNETHQMKLSSNGSSVTGLTTLPGGPENNSGSVANVLEFMNSKNVLVEGNTYDEGLRNNVLIEGMDTSDYEINDDLKILTSRIKTPIDKTVGKIYYVSENPDVATIDDSGVVSARSLGTTDTYAYTVWNDTIIKSNIKTITIVEPAESTEQLVLDEYVYRVNKEDSSINLVGTLTSEEIIFSSDYDSVSFVDKDMSFAESGIYTVNVLQGNKAATIYVIAEDETSVMKRNEALIVEDEDSNLELSQNTIKIARQAGQDIWGSDNNVKNLVTFSLSEIDQNNFTAIATLDGLPSRQAQSWDSSYLLLMNKKENGLADRDNYISVGKRAHADGFATVSEKNRVGTEYATGIAADNQTVRMTFAIEKQGDTIKLFAIQDGIPTLVQEMASVSQFSSDMLIAIAGWGDTQSNNELLIENVIIGEGNVDLVLKNNSISFLEQDSQTYELGELSIVDEGGNSYLLEAETNSLAKPTTFITFNGKTQVLNTTSFKLSNKGDYLISVVNQEESGKFSEMKQIVYSVSDSESVSFVNGQQLIEGLSLTVPEDLDFVHYSSSDGSQQSISIVGVESIDIEGIVIPIRKILSNSAGIIGVEADGFGLMDNDINAFISTESSAATVEFTIKLEEGTAILTAENEDHNIHYDVVIEEDEAKVSVPVHNGVVSVLFTARAKDGVSTEWRRVHILRNSPIKKGLASIKLNGTPIDPSKETIDLENKTSKHDFEIILNDENARYEVHNKRIENTLRNASYSVETTIRIVHKDQRTVEYLNFSLVNLKDAIDTSVLDALLLECEMIKADDYTSESFDAFIVLKNKAQTLLTSSNATQTDIDAMVISLKEAYDNLVEVDVVDKTELQSIIESYKDINAEAYTTASYAVFSQKLVEAKALLANPLAVQEEIDAMCLSLVETYQGLVLVEGVDIDKSVLEALLNDYSRLEAQDYTVESFATFKSILKEANELFDNQNASQVEVNEVVDKLKEAFNGLVKKSAEDIGDKTDKTTEPSKPTTGTGAPNTGQSSSGVLVALLVLILSASLLYVFKLMHRQTDK